MARSAAVILVLAGLCWAVLVETAGGVSDNTPVSNWGTLQGRVTWGGKIIPKQRPIQVNRDRAYLLSNGPILTEDCVIDSRSRGVRWVFVWLSPQGKAPLRIHPDRRAVPAKALSMGMRFGRYRPHALAVRQGQPVVVTNDTPLAHNLRWQGMAARNLGENILLAPHKSHTIKGLKADRHPIMLADNIHPWMRAWIRVFDHPYCAVTDADGKFTIRQAPAGTYRLVSWQESTGWGPGGARGVAVTIRGGGETVMSLTLRPASN